jgi:hypothetical protein
MNIYRVHVRSCDQFEVIGVHAPALTEEAVVQALGGVIIHELNVVAPGQLEMALELGRPTHEEALNDILLAAQQLGYAWVNATVSEWADAMVERAVLGGVSGLAIGAPSQNADVALVAAIVGSLVGAWFGSRVRRLEVTYQVAWNPVSGWILTAIPQPQATESSLRPGLSAA